MTLRDKVWDEVLEQLGKEGHLRINDLEFEETQRHTIRRVLREMEQLGWLERESPRSPIWRIGPKGRKHLDVSESKLKDAQLA